MKKEEIIRLVLGVDDGDDQLIDTFFISGGDKGKLKAMVDYMLAKKYFNEEIYAITLSFVSENSAANDVIFFILAVVVPLAATLSLLQKKTSSHCTVSTSTS